LGIFFGPLIWGPPKRGLYEEWVRAGSWARGQIDTFNDVVRFLPNNGINYFRILCGGIDVSLRLDIDQHER